MSFVNLSVVQNELTDPYHITRFVRAVIRDEHWRYLTLKTKKRGTYNFPWWWVDEGESYEQTLARELQEELGVDIAHKEYLWVCPFIASNGRHHGHFYAVQVEGVVRNNEPEKIQELKRIELEYGDYPWGFRLHDAWIITQWWDQIMNRGYYEFWRARSWVLKTEEIVNTLRLDHVTSKDINPQEEYVLCYYGDELLLVQAPEFLARIQYDKTYLPIKRYEKEWMHDKLLQIEARKNNNNVISNQIDFFVSSEDELVTMESVSIPYDHPLLAKITTIAQKDAVKHFPEHNTPVFTWSYAINPITHFHMPIWVSEVKI